MAEKAPETGRVIEHNYVPAGPTLRRLHESNADVRIVLGPFGSGKSFCCEEEIFMLAKRMPPCKDNVRRSTACFVRETATSLSDTTMKTWLSIFPEDTIHQSAGHPYSLMSWVKWSPPMEMQIVLPMPDGTLLDLLIYCRHQATEADAELLKGLDLSFAFADELTGIPKFNFTTLKDRLGRFPRKCDLKYDPDSKEALEIDPFTGYNRVPRFSLVACTNMPAEDSWIYDVAEVKTPDGWEIFKQPPAMFEEIRDGKVGYVCNKGQRIAQGIGAAENVENHTKGWKYYTDMISGNDHARIRVFVCAKYGALMEGEPVYSMYRDDVNYTKEDIPFERGKTLFLGGDWGLWPSIAFMQMSDYGQLQIIDEVDGDGEKMGIQQLWNSKLKAKLINEYGWGSGTQIFMVGDPASGRSEVDMDTCFKFLRDQGINIVPCVTNDPRERIAAVSYFMQMTLHGGRPAFMIGPKAKKIRKGCVGGYCLKKKTQYSVAAFAELPDKNSPYSHLMDAVQYPVHAIRNPDLYEFDWRNRSGDSGSAELTGIAGFTSIAAPGGLSGKPKGASMSMTGCV